MGNPEKRSVLSIQAGPLRMTWTWFRAAYTGRAGGGVWYRRDERWQKIAELAHASCLVESDQVHRSDPVEGSFHEAEGTQEVRLRHAPLVVDEVTWAIEERWQIAEGDNRIHWRFTFTPSGRVEKRTLVSTTFSVLPGAWRAHTLPSCCGLYDGLAYAVFPQPDDPWWMRLEAPRITRLHAKQLIWEMGIRNVHYPFTYVPTKVVQGAQPVVLEGYFLVDQWDPERLATELCALFAAPVQPPARSMDEVEALAFGALQRAFSDARGSGLFAQDEGLFTDMVISDGWMHQHNDSTFGVGFSCGFSGHAIIPLLQYHEHTGNAEAREMARQIANWVARHGQTAYGAYHNLVDISGPWGLDFIGEDLVYTHTTARVAENLFAAYQSFGDQAYRDSAVRACDWLLSLQERDGGLPWKIVGTTGESDGTDAHAAASAEVLSAWVAAWQVTGSSHYLEAAHRLAEWVIASFVEPCFFGGYITDDRPANGLSRWETPSSPAVSFTINGLTSMFRATGKRRYLEAARRAGYYHLLWQWAWEPPQGSFHRRLRGLTQAAGAWNYTVEQTLGNEIPEVIEGFLNLYECTKEAHWLEAAKAALFCLPEQQFSDPKDPKCGTIYEGWNVSQDHEVPLFSTGWSRGLIGGTSGMILAAEMYKRLAG